MFYEDVSEEDSEDMEDGDADENVNGEDEVMPEQDAEESENTEENAVIEEAPKKKIIGDTMPLDEALRRLLGPEREDVLSQDADEEEPELEMCIRDRDSADSLKNKPLYVILHFLNSFLRNL